MSFMEPGVGPVISGDIIDLPEEHQRGARAFLLVICNNPTDGGSKRVFADWLDEHDEPALAYAYRWMGKRNLHPHHRGKYPDFQVYTNGAPERTVRGRRVPAAYGWAWYNENAALRNYGPYKDVPRYACLPGLVAQAVVGYERHFFPSYAAAVAGLAQGLQLLQESLGV